MASDNIRRALNSRVAVTTAGCLAIAISVTTRAPLVAGSPASAQAGSTAVIAGTVTSPSGVPLARVRVTLSPGDSRTTLTDDRGAFAFANLGPDEYTLSASKTGYLDVVYGQRRPGSGHPGTPIRLAAGQRFDRITLHMPRSGVITGVVFEDNGEPAVAVLVRAYRWTRGRGEPTLVPTSFGQTDDRGVYRIPFLQPGDYILAASPGSDVDLLQRVAENSSRIPSYAPVFHPGTTRLSEATSIKVDIAEERSNVNIPLHRVTTARIAGTVVWPGGGSQSGAHVTLVDYPQWVTSIGTRSVRTGSTGDFVFNDVAPGPHTLIARTEGDSPLWARVELSTDGREANVVLTMRRGMNVTGSVTIDDARPASPGGIRMFLSGVGVSSLEPTQTTTIQPNGTFQFRSVPPGQYLLAADPLPPGHSLHSAIFGGREVLDAFLEVKPNEDLSGVVNVSSRSTGIVGSLKDSDGAAISDYMIVIFASDSRYWTSRSRRIQATRPSTDGQFVFRGLPAGAYRLVAITDADPDQWFDPSFLQQITADAVPVTLSDGEHKVQDLRRLESR